MDRTNSGAELEFLKLKPNPGILEFIGSKALFCRFILFSNIFQLLKIWQADAKLAGNGGTFCSIFTNDFLLKDTA